VTVKDKVGRRRYIAFRVETESRPSRDEMAEAIRRAAGPPEEGVEGPRLVVWTPRGGLVRCAHTAKEQTIALLRGIDQVAGREARVETLGTSGTIRRARRKYLEGEKSGRLREASK
jgi:ribonuclease P/MRP protein subunit POP5